jgi:hypothetical protein
MQFILWQILTSVSLRRGLLQEKGHQASRPTYTAIKGQQLNSCSSYAILVANDWVQYSIVIQIHFKLKMQPVSLLQEGHLSNEAQDNLLSDPASFRKQEPRQQR